MNLIFTPVDKQDSKPSGIREMERSHLRKPFFLDVFEASGTGYAETYKKNIRLGVRQGSEPIVILLPSRVEESKCIGIVPDHDRNGIVVEDSGNIFGWKLVCRVPATEPVVVCQTLGQIFWTATQSTYEISKHVYRNKTVAEVGGGSDIRRPRGNVTLCTG